MIEVWLTVVAVLLMCLGAYTNFLIDTNCKLKESANVAKGMIMSMAKELKDNGSKNIEVFDAKETT